MIFFLYIVIFLFTVTVVLLWAMVTYSATMIITNSKVTKPIRLYINSLPFILTKIIYELISCKQCTGFWVGCIFSIYLISPFSLFVDINIIFGTILDGLLAIVVVLSIDKILGVKWD